MNKSISLLICTYNRPALLAKCLLSILELDEKPDEVVIVNGGSMESDHVARRILSGPGSPPLKLIRIQNINLAHSRNAGLKECAGDIIAMTDDDARLFPDWITEMRRVHGENPQAGAVGGRVIGLDQARFLNKIADALIFPDWTHPCEVRTLPGVNISYKKEALQKAGDYDVGLARGEDVDINWRIIRAGYKILFDPAIRVYHFHRPSFAGLLKQNYMYGRYYYAVRKKWPDIYSVYPRSLDSWKNAAKAIFFMASLFYFPVKNAGRIPGFRNRVVAVPFLFLMDAAWKAGLLTQCMRDMAGRGKKYARAHHD